MHFSTVLLCVVFFMAVAAAITTTNITTILVDEASAPMPLPASKINGASDNRANMSARKSKGSKPSDNNPKTKR